MDSLKIYWTQRNVIFLTAIVSLLSLSWAFVAQYRYNVNPCILCYYERYIYGAIVILGILTLLSTSAIASDKRTPWLFLALGILLLGGSALGIYHLGVEWHWWQGTAACGGIQQKAQSIEELRQLIAAKPMARCDQINWRIFGISATLWNLFWFLGFSFIWIVTAAFTLLKRG
jgi:disulfide bond formation protein DsbB